MSKISQQRRDDILAAAYTEFSQNGFEGTSMAAIASRAGIGKSTIYEYFPSKALLLTDACIQCIGELDAQINEIFDTSIPVREKLIQFCHVLLECISTIGFLGMGSFASAGAIMDVIHLHAIDFAKRMTNRIEDLLRQGQQSGEVLPFVDIGAAALLIVALPNPRLVSQFDPNDSSPCLDRVLDFILSAICTD